LAIKKKEAMDDTANLIKGLSTINYRERERNIMEFVKGYLHHEIIKMKEKGIESKEKEI
jgi:hypothetical protein